MVLAVRIFLLTVPPCPLCWAHMKHLCPKHPAQHRGGIVIHKSPPARTVLWLHLADSHGLITVISELDEIILLAHRCRLPLFNFRKK